MTQNAGSPHVHVRPLASDDRVQWGDLWTGYLSFYDTALPPQQFDLTFSRLLDISKPDMFGFVAEENGALLGLVHVIVHDHCWKPGKVLYLQDLYASPESRGRGIGRTLIERVYKAADDMGADSTYWLTQEFNSDARVLYDRVAQLTPFIKYQRA
ncbi:N-acetyltransferase family protein [Primorskyibacter sp. S187A]|uniref:GNAT family N-acetyltransferase n=1 Tax=Primorskyibacter sp. S187A TaxID=3415130 RepID=UPI003C7B079C